MPTGAAATVLQGGAAAAAGAARRQTHPRPPRDAPSSLNITGDNETLRRRLLDNHPKPKVLNFADRPALIKGGSTT